VEAEIRAAEEAYQKPNRGLETPRYFERKTVAYMMIGALVAVVPFIIMLLERELRPFSWAPFLILAGVGALVGSRRRMEYCGGCWMLLTPRDQSCPKCGATLGEMLHPLTKAQREGGNGEDGPGDGDRKGRGTS